MFTIDSLKIIIGYVCRFELPSYLAIEYGSVSYVFMKLIRSHLKKRGTFKKLLKRNAEEEVKLFRPTREEILDKGVLRCGYREMWSSKEFVFLTKHFNLKREEVIYKNSKYFMKTNLPIKFLWLAIEHKELNEAKSIVNHYSLTREDVYVYGIVECASKWGDVKALHLVYDLFGRVDLSENEYKCVRLAAKHPTLTPLKTLYDLFYFPREAIFCIPRGACYMSAYDRAVRFSSLETLRWIHVTFGVTKHDVWSGRAAYHFYREKVFKKYYRYSRMNSYKSVRKSEAVSPLVLRWQAKRKEIAEWLSNTYKVELVGV